MRPESALERNANVAGQQPPAAGRRVLTSEQDKVIKDYGEAYDISPDQIYFDGSDARPYFDFDALSVLAHKLSNEIISLTTSPLEIDKVNGIVSVGCEVTLKDGRTRAPFAVALVGEMLTDGRPVETIRQAVALAQARACRTALRIVGFDPVKAHEAKKAGVDLQLDLDAPRNRELAEAHMLGEELGLIRGDDKTAWRRMISVYFPGKESSAQLTDSQRTQWIAHLRAMKSARSRAMSNEVNEGN